MAVAEYMFVVNQHGKLEIPGFIGDRGHWYNPVDRTYVGWIPEVREYYVPDTMVYLDKAALVARVMGMHAANPMSTMAADPTQEAVAMTDAEVTAMAETWYDNFVTANS